MAVTDTSLELGTHINNKNTFDFCISCLQARIYTNEDHVKLRRNILNRMRLVTAAAAQNLTEKLKTNEICTSIRSNSQKYRYCCCCSTTTAAATTTTTTAATAPPTTTTTATTAATAPPTTATTTTTNNN